MEPESTQISVDSSLLLSQLRARRRQNMNAQQQRLSQTGASSKATTTTMAASKAAVSETDIHFASDDDDESERSELGPVEKLMYYIDLQDKGVTYKNNQAQNPMPNGAASSQSHTSANQGTPVQLAEDNNVVHRYFDIGCLPTQVLLPITGYNLHPLVSLQQAIEPVRDLLDNIDVNMTVARDNSQRRVGVLSLDEASAIQLYTMESMPSERCLYFVLNKTLRTANRRELFPWFPYLKLLLTALWKLPSVPGLIWRGIRNVNLTAQYEEGKRYTWWNLSSCTETITIMETPQFLGNSGLRTLFSIQCENGKNIQHYSYLNKEKEILLPPATYFEVLGKLNPAPDLHIIQIKEIKPPYELISPPY
jgi:hypothetical protein